MHAYLKVNKEDETIDEKPSSQCKYSELLCCVIKEMEYRMF